MSSIFSHLYKIYAPGKRTARRWSTAQMRQMDQHAVAAHGGSEYENKASANNTGSVDHLIIIASL